MDAVDMQKKNEKQEKIKKKLRCGSHIMTS